VRRSPLQNDEIEIRPVFSPEDFGDALLADVREQEARLRAQGSA
jgi:hypothetical protein